MANSNDMGPFDSREGFTPEWADQGISDDRQDHRIKRSTGNQNSGGWSVTLPVVLAVALVVVLVLVFSGRLSWGVSDSAVAAGIGDRILNEDQKIALDCRAERTSRFTGWAHVEKGNAKLDLDLGLFNIDWTSPLEVPNDAGVLVAFKGQLVVCIPEEMQETPLIDQEAGTYTPRVHGIQVEYPHLNLLDELQGIEFDEMVSCGEVKRQQEEGEGYVGILADIPRTTIICVETNLLSNDQIFQAMGLLYASGEYTMANQNQACLEEARQTAIDSIIEVYQARADELGLRLDTSQMLNIRLVVPSVPAPQQGELITVQISEPTCQSN